jgi:dipeptidyl aminopeptidase/acylaminoacyl peptidase
MTAELKKNGVEHQLITVAGAEHGLAGAKPDEIQAVNKAAVEFLRKYLGAK